MAKQFDGFKLTASTSPEWLVRGFLQQCAARDAARLAKALSVTARDVKARPFQDSQCGTHDMPGIAQEFAHSIPPLRA